MYNKLDIVLVKEGQNLNRNRKLLSFFGCLIFSVLKINALIHDIEVFLGEDGIRVFCFSNYNAEQNNQGEISNEELRVNDQQYKEIYSTAHALEAAFVVENMADYNGNEAVKAFVAKHFSLNRDLLLKINAQTYSHTVKNVEFRQMLEALNAYFAYSNHKKLLSSIALTMPSLDLESIKQLDVHIFMWLDLVENLRCQIKRYKDNEILNKYYQKIAKQTGKINKLLLEHFKKCNEELGEQGGSDSDLKRTDNPTSRLKLCSDSTILEYYKKICPAITEGDISGYKLLNDYVSHLVVAKSLHQIDKLKAQYKNIFVCVSSFQGSQIKTMLIKQGYKTMANSESDTNDKPLYHKECTLFQGSDPDSKMTILVPNIQGFMEYHHLI